MSMTESTVGLMESLRLRDGEITELQAAVLTMTLEQCLALKEEHLATLERLAEQLTQQERGVVELEAQIAHVQGQGVRQDRFWLGDAKRELTQKKLSVNMIKGKKRHCGRALVVIQSRCGILGRDARFKSKAEHDEKEIDLRRAAIQSAISGAPMGTQAAHALYLAFYRLVRKVKKGEISETELERADQALVEGHRHLREAGVFLGGSSEAAVKTGAKKKKGA